MDTRRPWDEGPHLGGEWLFWCVLLMIICALMYLFVKLIC